MRNCLSPGRGQKTRQKMAGLYNERKLGKMATRSVGLVEWSQVTWEDKGSWTERKSGGI